MTIAVDPFAVLAARWAPPVADPYLHDPVRWAKDRLDIDLWSIQRTIAESVRDNPRTAVHASFDLGKSFIAAVLVCWWIDVHPPGSAFVATTAPTGDQVKAVLWREINGLVSRAIDLHERDPDRWRPLPGRINQTEWWLTEPHNRQVALGRKPNETSPESFTGTHAPFVLVILDEASGIPESLWEAGDKLATNPGCRILAIGNPRAGTHFEKVCKNEPGWVVHHIGAFESPNFTDEPVPDHVRLALVSREWVEDKVAKWGGPGAWTLPADAESQEHEHRPDPADPLHCREVGCQAARTVDPRWVSWVEGYFPADDTEGIVPRSLLDVCRLSPPDLVPADLLPVELGVDAAAGGDEFTVWERRGMKVGRRWSTRTRDPEEAAKVVAQAIQFTGATAVKVDGDGVGWALVGLIRSWVRARKIRGGQHVAVYAIRNGEVASKPQEFVNVRAEMWWMARELTRQAAWDLSSPDVTDEVLDQLAAPRWFEETKKGRIQVERKEEVIKRLGRSPDDADGIIYPFLQPQEPRRARIIA